MADFRKIWSVAVATVGLGSMFGGTPVHAQQNSTPATTTVDPNGKIVPVLSVNETQDPIVQAKVDKITHNNKNVHAYVTTDDTFSVNSGPDGIRLDVPKDKVPDLEKGVASAVEMVRITLQSVGVNVPSDPNAVNPPPKHHKTVHSRG